MEINIVNMTIHEFVYFPTHKSLSVTANFYNYEQGILFLTTALPHSLPYNLAQVSNLMLDISPGCLIWDQKSSSLLSACSKTINLLILKQTFTRGSRESLRQSYYDCIVFSSVFKHKTRLSKKPSHFQSLHDHSLLSTLLLTFINTLSILQVPGQ